MIGMDDIRDIFFHSLFQNMFKTLFVSCDLMGVEIAKTGAGVWHDVTHADNGKGYILFKTNRRDIHSAQIPYSVRHRIFPGHTGNQGIGITPLGRLTHDGLDVYPAPGGIGALAQKM
jgi:hypothetical protein